MKLFFRFLPLLFSLMSFSQSKNTLRYQNLYQKDSLLSTWYVEKGGTDYILKEEDRSIYIKSSSDSHSYCSILNKVPNGYKGDTLELSAFVKSKNIKEGDAKIMINQFRKGRSISYVMLDSGEIVGTTGWKKYSIKLSMDTDIDTIGIVGGLVGKGEVWFRDFVVKVDSKDIRELKLIEKSPLKVELDNEFDKGSQFTVKNLDYGIINRLTELCKVWGKLKYTNPDVGKGDYNWDYELFRILPIVKEDNFLVRLDQWKNSFGYGSTTIPAKHYYVDFYPNVGNAIFENEKSYKNISFDDHGFRLLSLFRYWNVIEYFYPYKKLIFKDWNQVLEEYIFRLLSSDNELKYKKNLRDLTREIGDGHSFFSSIGDLVLNQSMGLRIIPIKVRFIENKLVITELLGYKEEKNKIRIGDEIISIGGKPVKDLLEEKQNYYGFSNESAKLYNLASFMLRTNKDSLELELERDFEIYTESFSSVSIKDYSFYKDPFNSHKDINENLGYINIGVLKENELTSIMEHFKTKKGIILDFRSYPRIDLGELMKFFTKENKVFVKYQSPSKSELGKFNILEESRTYGDPKNYYKGKVSVLVDESTMSAAEFYTMALQTSENVKVIGTQTAGADGNISILPLPGNIQVIFTGIGIYYPDGTQTQKVGIKIDEKVVPTIQALKEGRDLILEKGIENLL